MKLILPIAGVGQRLRPFTFSKPKGFLKVGGQRVVEHILEKIQQSIGIPIPLAIIYGYKREQIQNYLDMKFGSQFDLEYIKQEAKGYQGDVPYFGGLGQAILLTDSWYKQSESKDFDGLGKDDVLIFLGDMIPVGNYDAILEELRKPEIDGIIGSMIVAPEKTQFYGIIENDSQGFISNLREKPKKTESNLAIAGVYAFKAKTMKKLYEIMHSDYEEFRNIDNKSKREFQFTPSLQHLVESGFKLKSVNFSMGILDFGRPEALLNGNQVLLKAQNEIFSGAIQNVSNSVIERPSSIGKNCTIRRSIIGPYVSIGDNCIIEDCNIKNSVIGDNSHLNHIITQNSIIGDEVVIDSLIKNNMILGDHSFVLESDPSKN